MIIFLCIWVMTNYGLLLKHFASTEVFPFKQMQIFQLSHQKQFVWNQFCCQRPCECWWRGLDWLQRNMDQDLSWSLSAWWCRIQKPELFCDRWWCELLHRPKFRMLNPKLMRVSHVIYIWWCGHHTRGGVLGGTMWCDVWLDWQSAERAGLHVQPRLS